MPAFPKSGFKDLSWGGSFLRKIKNKSWDQLTRPEIRAARVSRICVLQVSDLRSEAQSRPPPRHLGLTCSGRQGEE